MDEQDGRVGAEPSVALLITAAARADRDAAREHATLLPDARLLGSVVRAARAGCAPGPRGRHVAGIAALAARERAFAELGPDPASLTRSLAGLTSWTLVTTAADGDLLGATIDLGVRPWVVGLVAFWRRGTRLRAVAAVADGRIVGATVPDATTAHPSHSAGIVAASVGRAPRDAGSDAALAWGLATALGLPVEVDRTASGRREPRAKT